METDLQIHRPKPANRHRIGLTKPNCFNVLFVLSLLLAVYSTGVFGQSSASEADLPGPSGPTLPTPSNSSQTGANATTEAPRLRLGTACNDTVNCPITNSVCVNGTCVCNKGFATQTNAGAGASCVPQQPAGGGGGGGKKQRTHRPSQGENMIPMIVCLAIMFVGMCVALQLFSRARFRNQRSVFNSPNPRLLHLMKADSKKRRHSHVPVGSRRPSCASNMSVPRGSRPGSTLGSRAGSPDLRKQAALNSVAVIDMQAATAAAAAAADDAKATELASLVDKQAKKIVTEGAEA